MHGDAALTAVPGIPTALTAGRARIFLGVILLAYAALAGRLVQLQYVEHDAYQARNQRQTVSSVLWNPSRGTVVDARGQPLAVSIPVFSCALDPHAVRDAGAVPLEVLGALERALKLSPHELAQVHRGLER